MQILGRETRQNPIILENLLRQARDQLARLDVSETEAERLLSPAVDLIEDHDFWQHQAPELALYLSDAGMQAIKLPVAVPELAVAGAGFHISPLLPFQQQDAEFMILTLTAKAAHLWQATRFAMTAADVPGLPASIYPPDLGGVRVLLSSALADTISDEHLDRLADQLLGKTGAELAALVRDARTRARAEALEAECGLGFGPTLTWVPQETPYSLIPEPMRQRIEASLQAAQAEARAAMERHRAAVERVAGVLSERRELDAAQIADLLSGIQQEPVCADGRTSAGAA